MNPEASGQWLVQAVAAEAEQVGTPLSAADIELLTTPIWELAAEHRDRSLELNNMLVPLARARMEREKTSGVPTVKVRRGLKIPKEWQRHYGAVYTSELPWAISGIMQNAMLANPMAGETKPWKSR